MYTYTTIHSRLYGLPKVRNEQVSNETRIQNFTIIGMMTSV